MPNGDDINTLLRSGAISNAVAQKYGYAQDGPQPNYFNDAVKNLGLNAQEQAFYQRHLSNLYGPGGVNNPDGSRSTLRQLSFEQDGRTYNIPTVWNGKILNNEAAVAKARAEGLDQFPSYSSAEEAEARYQAMHDYMAKDTGVYMRSQRK